MIARVGHIALNTFREAVRDRVLYNLVVFAVLMAASALLFGGISIDIHRLWLVNLGLTSMSLFGVVIAIFIGIGLVSKEIEKRTLYTVLSRPVRRWEFLVGKYFGLTLTLAVNTLLMSIGFFFALLLLNRKFDAQDGYLLGAIYLILLQFLIVTALALLFSSFSSPLLSAVFAFAMFIIGSFADDLRGFSEMAPGAAGWASKGVAWVVPNLGSFNVISQVAHGTPVSWKLLGLNTAYALLYSAVAISAAALIFDRRNLK